MNEQAKQRQIQIFEKMPIRSAVRVMAVPTIVSQLIVLIYNMADTFFLGKTGNPYMVAAAALILPVFNITVSLAMLTGVGGGTCISRLLGVRDTGEARKVSCFSLRLALALSACFAILTAVFHKPLLNALGAGDNTFEYARQYVTCVVVIGGVPTVLSNIFANLLRSEGKSRKASIGLTIGGVLNILLDPLFMFVIMPAEKAVLGAGIATCISNYVSCVYFIIIILRMKDSTVIAFKNPLPRLRRESLRAIFAVGLPTMIAILLFDLDYMVLDKLMSNYSDYALAAIGIVLKVERLPLNVGIGICQAMVPLVAYNYAAGNRERMFGIIRYSRLVGLAVAALSLLLYELGARGFIRFFIKDPETLSLGVAFVRVRILATPLMFTSFFTSDLFNAFGKGRISLILVVIRWAVLNIPMLFLLNHLAGMYGLVWSQVTADAFSAALCLVVYARWKRKMTRELRL